MSVEYSGLLKFTDDLKAEINLAADGTVEKAVIIDGDGTETPIGGSSDYTTATVSITNNLATGASFAVAAIISLEDEDSDILIPEIAVSASATETVTVVLYKGHADCHLIAPVGQGVEGTTTGSIDGDGTFFDISGNGTITISAS